jgi:hypothetical protein
MRPVRGPPHRANIKCPSRHDRCAQVVSLRNESMATRVSQLKSVRAFAHDATVSVRPPHCNGLQSAAASCQCSNRNVACNMMQRRTVKPRDSPCVNRKVRDSQFRHQHNEGEE